MSAKSFPGIECHLALHEDVNGLGTTRSIVHTALDCTLGALRSAGSALTLSLTLAYAATVLAALQDFTGAKRLLAEAAAVVAKEDAGQLQEVRCASAKVAFWAGEYGATVETLATTVLPGDTRERTKMLLILAAGVVAVGGGKALARGLDYLSRAEALVGDSAEDPVSRVHCAKARFLSFLLSRKARECGGGRRSCSRARAPRRAPIRGMPAPSQRR